MELDVTNFVNSVKPSRLSASQAELGKNTSTITWNNSLKESVNFMILDSPEKIKKAKDYFLEFGAWEQQEIDSWSEVELNALLLQYIAGSIREQGIGEDIYRSGGKLYFYLGH